ncbi:hypothetical protein [Bilifractor porci]|jgi:hypothetical protein|uniref:hypothetical protein n=1 Tax=Bilifractor porci TaxID=2606636 RepID=UPI0012B1F726|nr:hypothetical protein [Bilifractor porci]
MTAALVQTTEGEAILSCFLHEKALSLSETGRIRPAHAVVFLKQLMVICDKN